MSFQPMKPLTEPEAICIGFVRTLANPGPDTLRITVQTPEHETTFALCQDECAQLAALLLRYIVTWN